MIRIKYDCDLLDLHFCICKEMKSMARNVVLDTVYEFVPFIEGQLAEIQIEVYLLEDEYPQRIFMAGTLLITPIRDMAQVTIYEYRKPMKLVYLYDEHKEYFGEV